MGVELAFGIAGGIILIGVLANLVGKKFGVPDVPLLIGLGILLGPLTGIVQESALNSIAPAFAALAITVIVFEGGIHLRIARVASQAGRAAALAVGGYLASVFLVGVAMNLLMGWPFIDGMVLGSALGGSSSVVVFSLLKRASPSEKSAALLSLESSLTDVPVLVVTVSLIPVVLGIAGETLGAVFFGIFQSFVIGGVVGVAGGVVWLKMLDKMEGEPYKDIATIGFLLGAYAVSESMGGSGVMCALIMGVIMGNGREVRRLARLGESPIVEGISKPFHEQISFALTTFFFVYLGLFFNLTNPVYFLAGGAVSAVLFAGRYLAVMLSTAGNSILRMDTWIMTVMYPRGLSNAVMAQAFLTAALPVAFPLAQPLVEVLLSVILWTVVSSSLIVVFLPSHLTFHLGLPSFRSGKFPHTPQGESRGPHPMGFGDSVVAMVSSARPGIAPDMGPIEAAFGSFTPTLAYSNGKETAVFDVMSGEEDVGKIPTKVKCCQEAKVAGSLSFVVDDLTAFRHLPKLLLVEEYCRRSKSLNFRVALFVLDERKRRLVPIVELSPALRSAASAYRLPGAPF